MQKTVKRMSMLYWVVSIAALIGTVLISLSFLFYYDSSVEYFNHAPLTACILPLCFLTVIFLTVFSVLVGKVDKSLLSVEPHFHHAAWIPAAGLVLFACYRILLFFGGTSGLFPTLLILFSLLSCIYFCMVGFRFCPHGDKRALAGFAPTFFCALLIAYVYFDMTVAMNNPQKLLLQFGFASLMLYCTSELRFVLCKPAPRLYLGFGSLALFFGAVGFIGCFVAYLCGASANTDYFSLALLGLFFLCYVALRLFSYVRALHAPICNTQSPFAEMSVATDCEENADIDTDANNISTTEQQDIEQIDREEEQL